MRVNLFLISFCKNSDRIMCTAKRQKVEPPSFLSLPRDIIILIGGMLQLVSLGNLFSTCRALKEILSSSTSLRQRKDLTRFKVQMLSCSAPIVCLLPIGENCIIASSSGLHVSRTSNELNFISYGMVMIKSVSGILEEFRT